MIMTIDDPEFLASCQKVEGYLKCLYESWEWGLTRMKDGDKDYKSMLPCYYVEKSDALKECA